MSIREVAVMQVPGPLETLTTMEAGSGTVCPIAKSEAEQWYALVVKPRHDKVVSKTLEHKGYQTLVPLYKKRQRCAARFKESELPLFPGYVFCRFNLYCFTHSGLFVRTIKLEGVAQCCVASDGTAYAMENDTLKYLV